MRTEERHPSGMRLDEASPEDIAKLIVEESVNAASAVGAACGELAKVCRIVAECYSRGGSIIYVGAGTSGRVAALDAAEMPPTFGAEPGRFIALIAGAAAQKAVEDAEDDIEKAQKDVEEIISSLGDKPSIVIGLSASGTTPYTVACVRRAKSMGSQTVGIANNANTELLSAADIAVLLDTGPEILAGSTRMNAATAQKIALNIISTGGMAMAGLVKGGVMSHMTPKNDKLRRRAIRIVSEELGVPAREAEKRLADAGWDLSAVLQRG